jgi:hypothetical protein
MDAPGRGFDGRRSGLDAVFMAGCCGLLVIYPRSFSGKMGGIVFREACNTRFPSRTETKDKDKDAPPASVPFLAMRAVRTVRRGAGTANLICINENGTRERLCKCPPAARLFSILFYGLMLRSRQILAGRSRRV